MSICLQTDATDNDYSGNCAEDYKEEVTVDSGGDDKIILKLIFAYSNKQCCFCFSQP